MVVAVVGDGVVAEPVSLAVVVAAVAAAVAVLTPSIAWLLQSKEKVQVPSSTAWGAACGKEGRAG